jgi:hypothetical protein
MAQEIERLEHELERLHGTIASGGRGPGAAFDSGGLSLNAFMDRVRQLRDQLDEKRSELSRIERGIARERQLLGHPAGTDESKVVATPASTESAPTAPRAKNPTTLVGPALGNALREAKIADRSEYVLVEGLAEGLASDEAEVRRQAVAKLGSRPRPVVSLLLLAANDPEDSVRLAALGALTGQRHPTLAGLFRRFLRDTNPALRLAALRGLASIDEPQVTHGDLVAALEDSDAGVRRVAASVLSWHREDAKVPLKTMHALGLALYDQDEAVRVSAAEALGTAGDDRMVLALIRAVGDSSEAVSKAAQRSLHSVVGPEIDSIAQGAPAGARVDALKVWWRAARVRLRSGPTPSGGASLENAARDVLDTLATIKVAPAPDNVPAQPPKEAPRGVAERAPEVRAAPAPKAEVSTVKEASIPAQTAAAAPTRGAEAAPPKEAKAAPEPQVAGATKAAEPPPPAADAEDKGEFESMFQETDGGDASEEGYETLLGGEKEP